MDASNIGVVRTFVVKRRHNAHAFRSAYPLLLFVVVFFIIPIGLVFKFAVYDGVVQESIPSTLLALKSWDGKTAPNEKVFSTLAQELKWLNESYKVAPLGQRLGYEISGAQVLLSRTARVASAPLDGKSWKSAFIDVDPKWDDPKVWSIIKSSSGPFTSVYLRWATGFLHKYPAEASDDNGGYDFPGILAKTITTSVLVTVITVLLGYPVAYFASERKGKVGALVLCLVLLPFWTSLLVRSMSWVVLLQGNGIVVELLQVISAISPNAQLLYTGKATILAMTQIQLPFTILPMVAIMKTISPVQLRAARSLGAGPFTTHLKVYLPQAMSGVAAGAGITFILCLGFYITPALVGGAGDQMVSYYVARFTNTELNWNLAAALSLVLLVLTFGGALAFMRLSRNTAGVAK